MNLKITLVGHFEKLLSQSSPGTRIPGDRELARAWNCSVPTVRSVLKPYVEKGIVHRIRGKGTFAGPPQSPPELPPIFSAVERVAAALQHDVSSGRVQTGALLPDTKQLCAIHGAAPSTVTNALRHLASMRIISRTGRKYRAGPGGARNAGGTTVHLFNCSGADLTDLTGCCELEIPLFRAFDRELQRNGYRVQYRSRKDFEQLSRASARNHPGISAIAVGWIPNADYATTISALKRITDRRGTNMRTMILTGSHLRPPARVYQLCTGNITTTRARKLTEFIRDRQYASVTLFERFDPESGSDFVYNLKFVRDMAHFCPDIPLHVCNLFPLSIPDPAKVFAARCEHITHTFNNRFLAKYRDFDFARSWQAMDICAGPDFPFEKYRPSDLWIFQRDLDAGLALDWLRSRKIDVPVEKEIISQEGTDCHYGQGLTLCTSDWETTGYMMAHAMIGDIPVARTSHGFLRTEALILERQTTHQTTRDMNRAPGYLPVQAFTPNDTSGID